MNRGTLPIIARLQSLQATSRIVPGGGRVIAEPTDRNPVAHLLRAANETMLGRSLRFDSSAGPSLTLDVSGRRVLRLTDAQGLPGADSCLGLEALEDEHKDDLIKLLQAVAAPRHELRVTTGPIGRGGEQVSVGLPVALLADLLLIELNATGPDEAPEEPAETKAAPPQVIATTGSGLSGFAAAMGPAMVAWLISGGAEDGLTGGAEEMVSHLQGFLADEREALEGQFDALSAVPGDPICMALGATLVDGHSIISARIGAAVLLGIVEGDTTATTLMAWQAILR